MDFKAARKALKQGHPITVKTAYATHLVEFIGTRYAHLSTGGRIPLTDILSIAIEEPPAPQTPAPNYRLTQGPGYAVIEIHQPRCGWSQATHQQVLDLVALELAHRGIKTDRLQWSGNRLVIDRDGRGNRAFNFPARFPSAQAFEESLDGIADHYKAIDQTRAQLARNPALM